MPGISYRALPEDERPLVFVSDAVLELTGYPATDFVNKRHELNLNNLIHPDDWEQVRNDCRQRLGQTTLPTIEYRHCDTVMAAIVGYGNTVAAF